MADDSQFILPRAIYLDANALIAVPHTLATQPFAEMMEMADILGAGLFVPQLAAEEWLSRCCSHAVRRMTRVADDAKQIGSLLDRKPLQVELISDDELLKAVRATQATRLQDVGVKIIRTPQISMDKMIDLFLTKAPPFGDGDKGFKDAVILETILQHACRDNNLEHIVIVSSDKIFSHHSVISQFADTGTTVHVVDGAPQDLLPRTNEKLRTMIDQARNAIMANKRAKAVAFAKQHEAEILAFVSRNATISMSLVKGYGLRQYGRKKDENDRKLQYARVVSIDSIRPLFVESASAYDAFPRKPDDGRKTFLITVRLEIDLTISRRNLFAGPRVPIDNASALLDEQSRWRYPETEESITVKRDIQVSASVSAEGFDTDDFQDLRLEKAY